MSQGTWTEKFGLNRNPFQDTLDTDLFFRTRQHEEALIKVRIGIEDRHALVLLVGQSGTGKTLVSQLVLRGLDQQTHIPAFIYAYPGMGKGPLLAAILAEIGVDKQERFTHQRLNQLQDQALALHSKGKRLVILIDEAHFLKADALHLLRTLSNLETEQEKLITVLLVAEQSLARRLLRPTYDSLRGRITFSVGLEPLTCEETEQFIKFRLLKCGGPIQLLDKEAYETVHRISKGIPREINRLLYNGFIEALTSNHTALTSGILQAAGKKIGLVYGKVVSYTSAAA
ncbi:MAG: AAA family ATPase [Deltaproteobacteria bacterium]|nr:AAA family ATPase [Deltaproteobacteria bacterium]